MLLNGDKMKAFERTKAALCSSSGTALTKEIIQNEYKTQLENKLKEQIGEDSYNINIARINEIISSYLVDFDSVFDPEDLCDYNVPSEGGRRLVQHRRPTKKTKKVIYRGLKHAKKTRKPARKPKNPVNKSRKQKKSTKPQRKTKRKQRGGNIFFDANKIPADAIYTGYNPSVEGTYTTQLRSDFLKDLEDDSMDTLGAQGI
jgi:hypothetical protein